MKGISGLLIFAVPVAGFAQQAKLPLVQSPSDSIPVSSAVEIHLISNGLGGVVLRNPGVDPSSAVVSLDGRTLTQGTDYTLNGPDGIITLQVPVKVGDQVTVSYRYGKKFETGSTPGSGLQTFNFGPKGAFGLGLGLMTPERLSDGSTYQSQLLSLATNFTGGGFGLKGGFLIGNRLQSNGLGSQLNSSLSSTEKFLQESLTHSFGGGKISFGYQDISSDFSAFNSLQGYSADEVNSLKKQAGLKMQSLGLDGVKVGAADLTTSVQRVSNGGSSLTSTSGELKSKTLDLTFSQHSVDSGFGRFDDLATSDREELKSQAGMNVREFGGKLNFGKGGLSFSNRAYHNSAGDLNITEASFTQGGYALSAGTSQQDSGFAQFQGLNASDRAAFSTYAGLDSKWLNFSSAAGKGVTPLSFSLNQLKGENGTMQDLGLGFGGKNWSVSHESLSSSSGFGHLTSLTAKQQDDDITQLSNLMGGAAKANAPAERGAFTGLDGLARSYTELKSNFGKNTTLQLNDARLSAQDGNALLDTLGLKSGQYNFDLQRGSVGAGFSEVGRLMGFEMANLGTINNSQFSQFSFGLNMGKAGRLDASSYGNQQGDDSASRKLFNYVSPRLNFAFANRQVSSGFTSVGQIADPERGLLASLIGFDQTVSSLSWDISKTLSLTEAGAQQNSLDGTSGNIGHQVMGLNYNHAGLSIGLQQVNDENTLSNSPIATASDKSVTIRQQTKNWNFKVSDEQKTVDPNAADPNSGLPVSQLQSYDAKSAAVSVNLSKTTTLSTAHSVMNFANGMQQTESSNSISTQIGKNMGISLTDTHIAQPDSSDNDQVHRNYGFWLNLGHDLVLRYGYQRDLTGPENAALASTVSLGQNDPNLNPAQLGALKEGMVGGFNVAGAYSVNQTETPNGTDSAFRTQAYSNIRLGTAKPLSLGFLKNVTLNYSQDTAADNFNWIRQDRQFGFGAFINGTAFAVGYHGQVNQSNQTAIDRTVSFTTDPKQKRFLSANIMYKMRTLPGDQQYMIRNYSFDIRPTKNLTISNQMVTNPDVPNGAALLGSIPQASRSNTWAATVSSTKDTSFGASWQELVNESAHTYGTTTGLDLTLFKTSSPLHLYFGLERALGAGAQNSFLQRWSIQFDQKVGPNQSFNFFVGDVSYLYTIPTGSLGHNVTARAEYNLRF